MKPFVPTFKLRKPASICSLLFFIGSAQATEPAMIFNPAQLKGPAKGSPNQVFVLGTPHLSGLAGKFQPAHLDLLLDHLSAWRPNFIVTENLSGVQCDYLRRHAYRYQDSVKQYCWDPASLKSSLNLSVPEANQALEKQLAQWPDQPSAAQRRHLAALFLAAGEPASALVQWHYLPSSERRAEDGLELAACEYLQKSMHRSDETALIAVALAVRLGLQRVYAVDDHSADSADASPEQEQAYVAAISKAWDNPATHQRQKMSQQIENQLDSSKQVLAMYRAYNQSRLAKLIFQSDFGAAMNETSPQQYGRNYLSYWETRNLRMVANLREVMGLNPGKRTLAIVGASHKAYYEAYLNLMHDVKVLPGDVLLRQPKSK